MADWWGDLLNDVGGGLTARAERQTTASGWVKKNTTPVNKSAFYTDNSPSSVPRSPGGSRSVGEGNPGDPGSSGPSQGDLIAAANAAARASAAKANQNTRNLADQQFKLLGSFGAARDTKLGNIAQALTESDTLLIDNYLQGIGSLKGLLTDNDKAESDASFQNISNAVRERQDLVEQTMAQGAGETDLLRTQLQALRNYGENQSDVNRSFFDSLRNVNNAIGSLNSDTLTGRSNIYRQAEQDRESSWANYYNQLADTWTQIYNIENSNSNVNSATSVAYQAGYTNAADEAAKAAGMSYKRNALPTDLAQWSGRGEEEKRALNSSSRAATVNLGAPMKKPEGSTLRKW